MPDSPSKQLASIHRLMIGIAVAANVVQFATFGSAIYGESIFVHEKVCLVALWAGMARCSLTVRTLGIVSVGTAIIAIYGPIQPWTSDFFAAMFAIATACFVWGYASRIALALNGSRPNKVQISMKDAGLSILIVSMGLAFVTRRLVTPNYDWGTFFGDIIANAFLFLTLSTASIPVIIIATQRRVDQHLLAQFVTLGVALLLAMCLQIAQVDRVTVTGIGILSVSLFLDSTLLRLVLIGSERSGDDRSEKSEIH
ncbi:hypothetical protein [Blastopirellula marina]|uniref:Uncharacterized protein n=1 Tax=Blastopirellula marina DSM 3645 TaxID=314230 RepID=A3ZY11_9BACT|nr:hypothetical protein [Blastopirellula marina]EAQ78722.1 hypothetical protein DSM3645_08015 [Blastopirellula marina DSM 3645]